MKRLIFSVLVLVLLANFALAKDTFMAKQAISKDATLYWLHNATYWGSEVLYRTGDKPWLLFGAGPCYKTGIGPVKVKAFAYFALMLDVKRGQWPVKFMEVDTFIVPSYNNWSLLVRTTFDIDPRSDGSDLYSGRDYIGYNLCENWQIRGQTEWKYDKKDADEKWKQTIGPGLCYVFIKDVADLSAYIAVSTGEPYSKAGWFQLKVKI